LHNVCFEILLIYCKNVTKVETMHDISSVPAGLVKQRCRKSWWKRITTVPPRGTRSTPRYQFQLQNHNSSSPRKWRLEEGKSLHYKVKSRLPDEL